MNINFPKHETIPYENLETTASAYAYSMEEYKPIFNGALMLEGKVIISPEKLLDIAEAIFEQTGTIDTYETAGDHKSIIFKGEDIDVEFYPLTSGDVLEQIGSGYALGWANETDPMFSLISEKISRTLVHADKAELEDHANRAFPHGDGNWIAKIEI